MVHGHARAVGRDDFVDRADEVVEAEAGVDGTVGAALAGDEVCLDAAEDGNTVLVFLGEGADVGHIGVNGVGLERPRIAGGKEGM